MAEITKIQFSDADIAAMANSSFFLTKRKVTEKLFENFSVLAESLKNYTNEHPGCFTPELLRASPKITKGENLEGLPFVLLDYPAVFGNENIFALRILYHWGNGFSLHLLLKGKYKILFENNLFENLKKRNPCQEIFYCVHKDPWSHYFRPDNYIASKLLPSLGKKLFEKDFIKIGISLHELTINKALESLDAKGKELISMILPFH